MKENSGSLRGFRSVDANFSSLGGKDMTESANVLSVASLFAEYQARLKEKAQMGDSPEMSALYLLSSFCNPGVFPGSAPFNFEKLSYMASPSLSEPGKDSSHPLYSVAQYTQSLEWGASYLKGAEDFTPQGLNPNCHMAVIEWHLNKDASPNANEVARVPIIINPDVNEKRLIRKTVEVLKEFETTVAIQIKHGQSKKKAEIKSEEHPPLWWPRAGVGGRLDNPILGALMNYRDQSQPNTEFFDVTLRAGQVIRKWEGGQYGPLFKTWLPNGQVWQEWSLQNTLYKVGQISFENIFQHVQGLKGDSFHLCMQILAAHADTVVSGISGGIKKRQNEQDAADEENWRREQTRWDHFSFE